MHLQWASPAICAGGVFLVPTSAFDVCTYNLSTCIRHNLIDNVKLSVAKRAINTHSRSGDFEFSSAISLLISTGSNLGVRVSVRGFQNASRILFF